MHTGIADNPNAGRAGSQGNNPDPVARPHQMVGRERALSPGNAGLPFGIGGPGINVDGMANAEPGGVGAMVYFLSQPQLALQQRAAPGSVHYPASPDLTPVSIVQDAQKVSVIRWL